MNWKPVQHILYGKVCDMDAFSQIRNNISEKVLEYIVINVYRRIPYIRIMPSYAPFVFDILGSTYTHKIDRSS